MFHRRDDAGLAGGWGGGWTLLLLLLLVLVVLLLLLLVVFFFTRRCAAPPCLPINRIPPLRPPCRQVATRASLTRRGDGRFSEPHSATIRHEPSSNCCMFMHSCTPCTLYSNTVAAQSVYTLVSE
eukprot:COSAG02_NODE_11640_length_1684_cov_2.107256_1_plen_124_part_10